ncbi:FMRFamide receptor [Musca domestica]|uniref:FMRFamide receptor n=1 Tax=Musca domestica TaxID=7370 RepID=A0A1I8M9G1_MUSDO|nr:FMRFamide receptor [Musca domestica]XP_005181778.1 FMRFamide receptor [Musca domestica]XP_005181780.1 FMRFamide receptor [Musca domestica]XP_011291762.1 FMRFamide receptor [Musca domestica]XP_058987559.1 FMRFamide receptor [Musca domestica]
MFDPNITDSVYPFQAHTPDTYLSQTPLPLLQRQQVLPPPKPETDYIGEFDSAPIDPNDFIESVSDVNHGSDHFNHYTTVSDTGYGGNSSIFATAAENFTQHSLYGGINYTNSDHQQYPCQKLYNPEDHETLVEFWVCGVCLNIVGILGIIGNVISMIILSRPQMRSSINYLLIGLACCDTVLIITSMLLFGIPSIYPYTGNFFLYYNYIFPYISPVVFPIGMISQTASIYMTFTVTLERYVAVCHPLKARALCTYGRAKIYFIVCVLFATLYNLPRFWEVVTASTKYDDIPDVLYCVRPSPLRANQMYINLYINWCYLIVNYIIPFLTLAILNCLIYRQVKRANRERQRLSRSEKREIGLATMLLCVVVVFFAFNFLALVVNISEAFYNFIDNSLTKTSNLLVTINSSCNFLIYVIFGEKFKRIFLLIFFKRRLSRDQPDLIHYESSISNNGDGTYNHRSSGRFSRHGTQRSTTTTYLVTTSGNSTLNNGRIMKSASSPGVVKIKRGRAPSPGPVVYYPAREVQRTSPIIMSNNNSPLGCDWMETKNAQMTSGF